MFLLPLILCASFCGPPVPPVDVGEPLAFPPAVMFSETYVGNPKLGKPRTAILIKLFDDLRAMGATEIETHIPHHFGPPPDITADPPWTDLMDAIFTIHLDDVGPAVASNIDNERIPLKIHEQLAWDDKTRNQWIAYSHGMLTTLERETVDQWWLWWKTPLTPSKRAQSWQGQELEDWKFVVEPWRWLFEEFPRTGIALDTFTGTQVGNEADWVVPLIENTLVMFPDVPVICVVSPTVKVDGIIKPLSIEEAIGIVQLRFDAGANGIQLFLIARDSQNAGAEFMSIEDLQQTADSSRAMMAHAIDLWGGDFMGGEARRFDNGNQHNPDPR